MSRRQVFFSFHHERDAWRAAQVRNMGVLSDCRLVDDNDWERAIHTEEYIIQNWIDTQMAGRECLVVLIGSHTSDRRWIKYEIKKAWSDGMGVVGVHIQNLKDHNGLQSALGENPFSSVAVQGQELSGVVETYDPPFRDSRLVYRHIRENIELWVERAIHYRKGLCS